MPRLVYTIAGIDSISGILGDRKRTANKKAIIVSVRRRNSAFSGGLPYMYMSVRQNDRSTVPSASEVAYRTKFGNICKQTHIRMKDPAHVSADQAAFKAQTEYATLYQFVWHLVADSIGD